MIIRPKQNPALSGVYKPVTTGIESMGAVACVNEIFLRFLRKIY